MKRPDDVVVGDSMLIKNSIWPRGGQIGVVVAVYGKGVALDFYRESRNLPSIEFWGWEELEEHCKCGARPAEQK